jgi:hypothetical protein
MMRSLFTALVLISIITPCNPCAAEPLVIKATDFPEGGGLTITSTDTVILDAEGFFFTSAHGNSFGPADTLAVHYVGDDLSGYYSMPFKQGERVIRINAESLKPRGNPAFPGFNPGATVFLMVGREFPEGSLDMGVFADQWTLNVRVQREAATE